jgi:TetR/AcrR family transcriptional repressor of lmrAB and yxaGH operons
VAPTRARMVEAAIASLRSRGVAGMSFTEVLAASGAARGAIYHHFPRGKSQLVEEAAARYADDVRAALADLPGTDPHAVVESFLAAVRPVVADSTRGHGCVVAAAAMAPEDPAADLRSGAARAFDSWIAALADRLGSAGLPAAEAADLAATLIALLEGAHVLCRAAGNLDALDQLERSARRLVEPLG